MNKTKNIPCIQCSATLKYISGANVLHCEYCGNEHQFQQLDKQTFEIQENDFNQTIAEVFAKESEIKISTVRCETCSAETTLGKNFTSKDCPFCSAPLVIKKIKIQRVHKPHYLLPFKISEQEAIRSFNLWINKLWFAPNSLTKQARKNKKPQGVFIPFWTFDCSTSSSYQGKRGTNYTIRTNNKSITKTRWHSVTGINHCVFNDVLIPATKSLPSQLLDTLKPWDLDQLKKYQSYYLTGHKTENYQITLRQAYSLAKDKMSEKINQNIKMDLGGDKQIINRVNTQYKDETFKHVLLPCWVSAYRFNNKTYQFVVNARTAKVQSERPYSIVKILTTATLVVLAITIILSTNWQVILEQLGLLLQH